MMGDHFKPKLLKIALLQLVLIFAKAINASPISDYENQMNSKFNCPKTSTCSCSYDITEYEINCPPLDSSIKVRLYPTKYVHIECTTVDEEYTKLPTLEVGEVDTVQFRTCQMPKSSSLVAVLDRLRVKNVRTLIIKNGRKVFSTTVRRDHLTGFTNLYRLVLSSMESSELPADVFDDVTDLKWLSLNYVKIHSLSNVLGKLQHLEILELSNNDLSDLGEGIFKNQRNLRRLNFLSNRLQNLTKNAFLGLESLQNMDLGSNNIETLQPDVFDFLTNLTSIFLNKNFFVELPEGLLNNTKHLQQFKLMYNQVALKTLPSGLLSNLPELGDVKITSDLKELPENLFAGSENIQNVSFANNKIAELPSKLFQQQINLLNLDLSYNQLTQLPDDLFSNTGSLVLLKLSYNKLVNISGFLFQALHNLKELYINNNNLHYINNGAFIQTKSLEAVYMQNNFISFTEVKLPTEVNSELGSPFQLLTKLRVLNLRNNSITNMFNDWVFKPLLVDLDLSYNNISRISELDLQFLSNGIRVNLSNNNITQISFDNLEKQAWAQIDLDDTRILPEIFLDSNPLDCNCIILSFVQFMRRELNPVAYQMFKIKVGNLQCNAPANLAGLRPAEVHPKDLLCRYDLPETQIKKCPSKCECWVRMFDKALIVNCSNAQLVRVPALPDDSGLNFIVLHIENNKLVKLPRADTPGYSNVTHIYASHNNISSLTIDNLPKNLRELDLMHNNLEKINGSVFDELPKTMENLTLSQNPWICDCDTISMLNYVQTQFTKIRDLDQLYCANGEKFSKLSPGAICPDIEFALALSVTMALLGLFLGLLAALYYKYQQEIKIWMYWNNVCPCIFNSDVLDSDKKYDAFISYSHKDEDFVAEKLVPELQYRRKFNLCIHKRDWTVGDFIPDQIIRSVAESRRTIIVLTPNFVESVWGTMEFRTAHHTAVKDNVSRVIVIIFGEVNTDNMDPELKSYIDLNTYIKWGDPYFWERLHYALRTIKTGKKSNKKLIKTTVKSSVDDKLELIYPSPVTPPLTTPPAESAGENPLLSKLNGSINHIHGNEKIPKGLNGHVNGAFIINTNSKQSDV